LDRTGEQLAVSRQREACEKIARERGWVVVAEFVDNDISASIKSAERAGYNALVQFYAAGEFDALVCWDLDRLTRQPRQLEDWIDAAHERGLRLVTANGEADLSTDGGRMFARIKASVARAEIERKSARQKVANEQRAEQGRPMWVRRPFGYERDGSLREAEAEALRRAYDELLRGRSLSAIGRDFDGAELPPTGPSDTWSVPSVRTLLRAPRNAALSTHYGEIVGQGNWEPIVSEATWRAADRLLGDPARHSGGSGHVENLLSGIAECAVCGLAVKCQYRGGKKGSAGSYAVYQCPKGHVSLPIDFTDSRVLIELTRRAEELGVEQFAEAESEDVAPLRAREADLVERLAEIGESFAAGEIPRTTMRAGTAAIQKDLIEVQRRIAEAGRVNVLAGVDVEALFEEFDIMDLDHQRAIVRSAFASIKVKPRGRGRVAPQNEHLKWTFSPEWTKA
jgi:site-specific DNA recombinase